MRTSRWKGSDPWNWYDKIGEVHYALSRAARIAGYTRLFPEFYGDNGEWAENDTGPAGDIIAEIYSPYGGVRGLCGAYFTLTKVPAEMVLIRYRDDQGYDGYHLISPDSVDAGSLDQLAPDGAARLKYVTARYGADGTNNMIREVAPQDVLGRVWTPSWRFPDEADSGLAAMSEECEELYLLTKSTMAKLRSRFALAGLLFVPQSMQQLQIQGRQGVEMAKNGLEYLITAMTTNVDNWDDAEAILPILMSGPGEAGEQIKHILLDREVWQTDIEQRRELIDRIYAGLDIQQQATKGVGESTHWSAWAVSDDELRLVAKPDMENMCWALTRLILQDRLMNEANMTPAQAARWRIGFEMNEAASKTNLQEDGRQLNDRGWLKGDVLADVSGFDPIAHKMTANEYIRWTGRQTKNPFLMLFDGDVLSDEDWDEVERFGGKKGPAGAVGTDPKSGPGVGDPGSPNPDDRED